MMAPPTETIYSEQKILSIWKTIKFKWNEVLYKIVDINKRYDLACSLVFLNLK